MAKRMRTRDTSRLGQLPDDILLLILSLLPTLAEVARTSILSRRWRNVWHHITCLDFDATTLLPIDFWGTCLIPYIAWVNKVIDARPSLYSVKELRIWYRLDASQSHHIDKWINFAVANPVEKLHLEFSPYIGIICPTKQYKLSEKSWYRVPSGPSNLKCLKSLFLSCVNVSKQFIEFILSNCPLLEDLTLESGGSFCNLDVSGVPPLLLKRLEIISHQNFVLSKLDAPCLTSLCYKSALFNPQKVDIPKLTDLTIGSAFNSRPIMSSLDHFWRYLPQLEKLQLVIGKAKTFKLNKMPDLVTLKYLKISALVGNFDPIYHRIINLINACPSLETFALEMFDCYKIGRRLSRQKRKQKWRKGEFCRCLKVLELHGAEGRTLDQRVAKCIVKNAPHLEKLIVDIRSASRHPDLVPRELKTKHELKKKIKNVNFVEAKANELCQGSCKNIGITVIS